ncbi:unnamed protein product [Vitrella brassicaformis CCMP3155]|uniref:Uncharacterized protein n=1 Tax=Vitrella brassicaformis (strain CCMP3155) TaxID=1169540 RepID=A0A0G4F3J6_VITBC|nr:unnamed protein product [Vitrella brassicaformis CCMP3155]|eukprot:CEM06774.1 unnamed protein product [Vitrella brassicaformis CCMP3155]
MCSGPLAADLVSCSLARSELANRQPPFARSSWYGNVDATRGKSRFCWGPLFFAGPGGRSSSLLALPCEEAMLNVDEETDFIVIENNSNPFGSTATPPDSAPFSSPPSPPSPSPHSPSPPSPCPISPSHPCPLPALTPAAIGPALGRAISTNIAWVTFHEAKVLTDAGEHRVKLALKTPRPNPEAEYSVAHEGFMLYSQMRAWQQHKGLQARLKETLEREARWKRRWQRTALGGHGTEDGWFLLM